MSKTCHNCGNIFEDDVNICPRCGTQFIAIQSDLPKQPAGGVELPPTQQLQPQQPQPVPQQQPQAQSQLPQTPYGQYQQPQRPQQPQQPQQQLQQNQQPQQPQQQLQQNQRPQQPQQQLQQNQRPQQSQQPQPMPQQPPEEKKMGVGAWFGTILLTNLFGIVSLVLLFVWAFGADVPLAKKNYCRAMLILVLIETVLVIGLMILAIYVITSNGLWDQIFNEIRLYISNL